MIARAVIHVGGPEGSGKTTLIERILGESRNLVLTARCVRDDSRRAWRESAPAAHAELRRYRAAGASGAALFTFPSREASSEAFFASDLMADYSEAVLLEGDDPLRFADLTVFVAPPLRPGETLLVRDRHGRRGAGPDSSGRSGHPLLGLDGLLRSLARVQGSRVADPLRGPPAPTDPRDLDLASVRAWMQGARDSGSGVRWVLADGYAGIERAQLVVVNARTTTERASGERLLEEVQRLRKDEAVFEDVLGPEGHRIPVTAVVANLADRKDAGTKKALSRIQRAIRSSRS